MLCGCLLWISAGLRPLGAVVEAAAGGSEVTHL